MRIIGYTSTVVDGRVLLADSTGSEILSDNPKELLDFLAKPFKGEVMRLCWELSQFSAPLLRLFGKEKVTKLAREKLAVVGGFYTYYDAPKVLSLTPVYNKKGKASIYEMQQFFDTEDDPGDPWTVAAYGDALLQKLKVLGIYHVGRLSSPAAVLEDAVLKHLRDVPSFRDVPIEAEEINQFAEITLNRPWITAYQLGSWGQNEVFDYDLSSAYPYESAQLYHLKYAKFEYSETPIRAHWGFLRGQVTIDCPVSPLVYRNADGSLANPIGSWPDIITLADAQFITKRRLGQFKMTDGWFITFTAPVKPFGAVINRLYQKRGGDAVLDFFVKRGLAGTFYGKLAAEYESKGLDVWNPLYASRIQAGTRLRVAEFIWANNLVNDIIHVSVDGFLSTKRVNLPDAKGMGRWRMDTPEGVIVVGSGDVFKKGAKATRPQGIGYDDLVAMIKEHSRASRYETRIKRRVGLGEAAAGRLSELGKVHNFHSAVDLLLKERKDRRFPKVPETGHDLLTKYYESLPIEIHEKEGDND